MAKRIGEILVEANVISQEQLDHALAQKRDDGRKLGHVLIDLKMVSETQLTQALSRQLSVPWVSLYHVSFSRSLLNYVPREIAERFSLVPIFVRKVRKQGETLYVAMDDPTNEAALAEVQKAAGLPVRPMIACPTDIKNAIRVYYAGEMLAPSAPSSQAMPASAAAPANGGARATRPDAAERQRPTLPEAKPPEEVETLPDDAAVLASDVPPPTSEDHPDADPEIEATEIIPKPKRGPRMVALTLLDGTTISLPAKPKRSSKPDEEEARPEGQLTARDLISALRAVAHGADASEILGDRPPQWEAMFAALLSLMLKKGLIADWEFIEEYGKI